MNALTPSCLALLVAELVAEDCRSSSAAIPGFHSGITLLSDFCHSLHTQFDDAILAVFAHKNMSESLGRVSSSYFFCFALQVRCGDLPVCQHALGCKLKLMSRERHLHNMGRVQAVDP